MNIKEIREKSPQELEKSLIDLRNKLTKLRFDISAKSVKNHRDVRKIKLEISRIMAIMNEKKNQAR